MNPDPYRGMLGADGKAYAADAKSVIESATPGQVAGFVAETIQGVGGTVELADGYLPAVYQVGGNLRFLCSCKPFMQHTQACSTI